MGTKLKKTFRMALFAVATLPILVGSGCRTNEENYRRAYEAAKQKQVEEAGGETIYNKIRREARQSATTAGGDTIAYTTQFVLVTKDLGATPASLKRYNLVAGQFKQLFHAKSLMNRLRQAGYSDSFVVQTREPYYYVIAASSDAIADIVALLKQFETAPPMKLVDPCPWILRPTNR